MLACALLDRVLFALSQAVLSLRTARLLPENQRHCEIEYTAYYKPSQVNMQQLF